MWIFGLYSLVAPCLPVQDKIALEAIGYIVPVRQATIGSKVGGQVIDMPITEGKKIKAGEVLARLESTKYKLALKHAQAKLELAKARYDKIRGGTPPDLRIAEAEIVVAQTEVEQTKWHLDSTTIVAPFSGTIMTKRTEVGALVHPLGFQVSAAICELADLTELEVDVAIAERDIHKISKGQKCTIRAAAFPARLYQGEVARIMPAADRAKGAIPVRVRIILPANDDRLRPEMAAVVVFALRNKRNTPR